MKYLVGDAIRPTLERPAECLASEKLNIELKKPAKIFSLETPGWSKAVVSSVLSVIWTPFSSERERG